MIPNSLISTITAHIYLCIFTLFLLSRKSFGIDHPYYEACAPRNCGQGDDIISYPFYIQGQQEPYCGFPGFELDCTGNNGTAGYPRIRLSENDYIVEEIHYNNKSVRVSNAAVSNTISETGCFPRIRNLTLERNYSVFSLGNVSNLILFSDCQERLSERLMSYTNIGCNVSSRAANSSFAMLEHDGNLSLAEAECEEKVVAPVELYGGGDGRNGFGGWNYYAELLRRGFLLEWTASDCSVCAVSGGRCGFNWSDLHFMCLCRDRPHSRSCKPRKRDKTPIIGAAVGSAFIITICVACLIIRRRYKWRSISSNISSKNLQQDVESASVHYGVPVFSYSELKEATHKFDPSKELGDGGFGAVYYGKLRDGREVAVKRLYEHNYKRVEQFMNEVKILTLLRHPNLVLLYGCTSHHSRELLLVYEYIPNGTVADHLHGDRAKSSPLTWPIRMNIAVETASALAYLHASDVIHRDVKSNNILLDENYCVKVADFGLSRLFPNDVSHVSTAPQGTPGYVDPEYHQCYQLTDKSDVYSFGVVLVELISSMPAVDISRHRHEINLSNLAINRIQKCAFDELIDPSLGYGSNESVNRMTTSVAELAFRCLQFDKEMRPAMDEVLAVLKEIQVEETKETSDTTDESNSVKPPPSPESEDVVLLKNVRFPPSPISVSGKWHSGNSTTPYTSG